MSLGRTINARRERIHAWENGNPRRQRRLYWAAYTVAFVVVALLSLITYPIHRLDMIWSVDGMEQYYPYFVFEGQWLRGIVSTLVNGGGLVVPMWSYDLGYGADIISELDVIFDPLNALSALCPERYSEWLFQFLAVFRLFLAGAAFSLFVRRFVSSRFSLLLGALLYSFSGTALGITEWPGGAWPLILFPLLLLGVERLLAQGRPALFIAITAAFFTISYYFSYMACLMLVPYCAARVVLLKGARATGARLTVVRFLKWVLIFCGCLFIGILLAGIALGPLLTELFHNERFIDAETTVPLLYSPAFYIRTITGFMSTSTVGSDCQIGFGGVAFLACVLLFATKGKNTLLKAAFIVMLIMLFTPALGSVMNGFNYATNRWVWAFSLLTCFIVARMTPAMLSANPRAIKVMGVAAIVLTAFVMLVPLARTERVLAACLVLAATIAVLAATGISTHARKSLLATCLVAGIALNAFYLTAPSEGGLAQTAPHLGSAYKNLTDESPNQPVAALGDTTLWRYDADPTTDFRYRSNSLMLGLSGIDFYNSFYNSCIDAYHTELGLVGTDVNFSYLNLDNRAALQALSGVKYFVGPTSTQPPYQFRAAEDLLSTTQGHKQQLNVYRASNTLPLAYTYRTAITREAYSALTPAQRQEALLQGVVLENSSLPQTQLSLSSSTITPTVTAGAGVTVDGTTFTATAKGQTVTLTFEGVPNAETYLYVTGMSYDSLSPLETLQKTNPHASKLNAMDAAGETAQWSERTDYQIKVTSTATATPQVLHNRTAGSHLYGGKDTWLLNMGYSDTAQTTMTITFDQPGEYHFSDLSVVCQPMGNFNAQLDALKQTPVTYTQGTNEAHASLNAPSNQAVFFSIPYSQGWSATVDEQPAEIKRANTGFMAVEVGAGAHDIELTYRTPGLDAGMAASGMGAVLFVVVVGAAALVRRRATAHAAASQSPTASGNTATSAAPEPATPSSKESR